jgi:hypothetical protein
LPFVRNRGMMTKSMNTRMKQAAEGAIYSGGRILVPTFLLEEASWISGKKRRVCYARIIAALRSGWRIIA